MASIILVGTTGCGLLPGAVPDWVTNRDPLESCGTEDAGHGEALNQAARVCLLDAFQAGGDAELISTMTSVEGDPITRIVRVNGGSVDVFIDATRDRYGSGAWERLTCTELVPVAEWNDPPNLMLPEEYVFVEDGCLPVPAS